MTSLKKHEPNDSKKRQLPAIMDGAGKWESLQIVQSVPEEEIWLAGQLSPLTRRAYKQDVRHFVKMMGVRSADQLRHVNRAAVIAWQNRMKDEGVKPRTVRRRLPALSSLE